jgi:hypothetical protein
MTSSPLIVATASVNANTKISFTAFDQQLIFKSTCLKGLNGTVGLVGLISCIRLVGSVIHRLDAFVNMAKMILWWLKHTASQAVTALHIRASKIVRLIASDSFVREGEDVLVACSCEEKDEVVDCLFW